MTKLQMIPHDGGLCPVDGLCVVKHKNGNILLLPECKNGDMISAVVEIPGMNYSADGLDCVKLIVDWSDTSAYCPIEIKEASR